MEKYDEHLSWSDTDKKLQSLLDISNELAELVKVKKETNRLKRLEMKQFVVQSIKTQEAIMISQGGSMLPPDKSAFDDYFKELEDEA